MKPEALLVSIRRIRMIEVDGVGAYAQLDLAIARRPDNPKAKPHFEIASIALFAHGEKHPRHGGRTRNRWEAR